MIIRLEGAYQLINAPYCVILYILFIYFYKEVSKMKFSIEQKNINKALSIVQRCISQKALQDVLSNVLIEVRDNEVVLIAHDHKLGCEIHLDAITESNKKILVNANLLCDFVRKLPEQEVLFEFKDDNFIEIKSGNTNIKLICADSDSFPQLNRLQISEKIMIPSLVLKDMIKMTIFAASNDEKSTHLNSSLLEISEEDISLVSCEFYRIAYKKVKLKTGLSESPLKKYLIPARATSELYKILQQIEDNIMVEISLSDKNIEFTVAGITLITQLIDMAYVDYKKIIRDDYKTRITVDKKMLYDALDRASLLVRMKDEKSVIFDIKDNNLSILINSSVGNFKEDLPIKLEGVDLRIAFNPRFILDGLKVIETENVIAEFNTGIRPGIFKTTEDPDYIYLVTPIKI